MTRNKPFLMIEDGVTSIEYALLAALIAMAIIAGVTLVGSSVETNYQNIATDVIEAVN